MLIAGTGEPITEIVAVDRARRFLNIPDDQAEQLEADIAEYLAGVTPVVESIVGPVLHRTETLQVRLDGDGSSALPVSNVLAVDAITGRSGVVDPTGALVNGRLLLPRLSGQSVTVTVTVGMETVPENVVFGALEILRLAWATKRASAPGRNRSSEQPQLPAFLVPHRAAAYLNPSATADGFA